MQLNTSIYRFKYESTIFSTFMSKQAKSFLFNYGKKLMNIVEVIKECIGNIRNCTKIREIDNYLISLEWNHEEFIFDEDDTMNGAIQKFQVKSNGFCYGNNNTEILFSEIEWIIYFDYVELFIMFGFKYVL